VGGARDRRSRGAGGYGGSGTTGASRASPDRVAEAVRLAELATDRRSAGWDVAGRDCARAGAIRVSSKPAFMHDCSESGTDPANDGEGALILRTRDGVYVTGGHRSPLNHSREEIES